jgi:hypothetical protein
MKLSPKAQLFVTRALAEAASRPLRLAAGQLGASPWSGELSPEIGRIAMAVLEEHRRQIRSRLESPLTEDEAADLSNDLGFVEAVCADLRRSLKVTNSTAR